MWRKICNWLLYKKMGWTVKVTEDHPDKYIICLAPHTSNWDFILGLLYSRSIGMQCNFMMKKEWFFWPLGPIFRRLGGVPVYRQKKSSMTDAMAEAAKAAKSFQELGIAVSNQFLFKCAELGAGIAFGQIIDKAILAERQNHFHAFGGEEFTPVGTSQGAISDAVAMRYRPIYALLQLIDSGKHYATDVARIMSESYLEVSEDGTVKLAKTAKQLLEDEFSLWTHNFKANKILQNIDGFRKMRKEIEGAGMTLAEFGLLTAEVPQFGQLAQLFEKKS